MGRVGGAMGRGENEAMISRHISFPGSTGAPLSAYLDLPDDEQPQCYALFAHCFTCTKDLKSMVYIDRILAERGMAVLRFDFTGLGESGGDFSATTLSSNVGDLRCAADFLAENYRAPSLLIGHSLGGTVVLAAAKLIPSCRAVVTIGAPSHLRGLRKMFSDKEDELEQGGVAELEVAGRPYRFKKDFVDDLALFSVEKVVRDLGKALLILHSPLDTTVSIDHAERIFLEADYPKSFISLDNADHLLLKREDARYAGALIAIWAERYC